MTAIKGVFIDAVNQTVTDIEFEPVLAEMYRLLRCTTVEFVLFPGTDQFVIVDEEGLFNKTTIFFSFGADDRILAGSGIIVGPADEEGNETSTNFRAEELEVVFYVSECWR